jgi:hypothetical protein
MQRIVIIEKTWQVPQQRLHRINVLNVWHLSGLTLRSSDFLNMCRSIA